MAAGDAHAAGDRLRVRKQPLLERAGGVQLSLEPLDVPAVVLPLPPQLDAAVHQRPQDVAIERLLNEVEGGAADRAHELLVLVVDAAGHQDHVDVRVLRGQALHQLEAVQLRHPDVEDGQVWRRRPPRARAPRARSR